MNHFGNKFSVSIFGESHGEMIGVVLDGTPSGIALCVADFKTDLTRRAPGAVGTTARRESDIPMIVSGLFEGITTGAPLTILFENSDTKSKDYSKLKSHPRPSHADLTAMIKFNGFNDYRGGGHFSGRVTVALVAAGVVAKKILSSKNISVTSEIKSIGTCDDKALFEEFVTEVARSGDSVGGVIECKVKGVKIGYGEPFFDSIESLISHTVFSVPAVKGIEFGDGFESARQLGSEHNDMIENIEGKCSTNRAGGISGGISNGNDIVFRVAVKPTASIYLPQNTFNIDSGKVEELIIHGRHDSCIAMRAGVVIESAAAIALCNL